MKPFCPALASLVVHIIIIIIQELHLLVTEL